jgi:sec-independent protein translocase protein TatA
MFRNPTADLLVILLIVLLIFGPKRLPTLGRQLGNGLREFKDSITGDSKDEEERAEITQTASVPEYPQASTSAGAPPASESAPTAPAGSPPERRSAEIGSERRS